MHQVYVVTASGYYTLIQGSSPTKDVRVLYEIKTLSSSIRPGDGSSSETVVLSCDESGMPTEESRRIIESISSKIFQRHSYEYKMHDSV
jgi:hypothetical protein